MKARKSWQIQISVFFALFVREIKTRFGGYRLGFFWAIFEPVMHIVVLTTLFTLLRNRNDWFGIPFVLFFATGVFSFFFFQKIIVGSINSISSNHGLFAYRQVKPIDAIIVRAFLEVLIIFFAMIFLIWVGSWFFNFATFPKDPLYVLQVMFVLVWMSMGLALVTAVIGVKYPEASQLIRIILRPLYFISGILFPLQAMPKEYHIYLLWNPVLHAVEQFRVGWFSEYQSNNTSLLYVVFWTLPILLFGLAYYYNNRTRVLMS